MPAEIWFPLPEGVELPPEGEVTVGNGYATNSIPTPEGFDPAAPGDIWDLLPMGQAPDYALSISPERIIEPVNRSWYLLGLTRTALSVRSYGYALTLAEATAALVSRTALTAVVARLEAEGGAFVAAGQGASLRVSHKLSAAVGAVALSGQSSGYVRNLVIGTNAGSFSLTGSDAALAKTYPPLSAEAGAVVLSGQAAALDYRPLSITGDTGSFALSGQGAGLLKASVLNAAAGSVSLSGQAATLTANQSAAAMLFYSGTGSTQSITGTSFTPGFVALKRRNATANHGWYDVARGTGFYVPAGQALAEQTLSTGLTSFNSDGFSLGTSTVFNASGGDYLAFALPTGGTASSNTNGSVTTTVSAQTSSEASFFTYVGSGGTNQTIGHGLSGTPDLVIIKQRAAATASYVGGPLIGDNYYFSLGSNSATATNSTSVFRGFGATTVSVGATLQGNGTNYRGWAFKAKSGTSNVGEFTGGGSTTHSITLGYQPKVLILKNTSTTTSDWLLCYRPSGGTGYVNTVALNSNAAEATSTTIQFTSDGFSVDVGGPGNVSGGTTKALYWAML